MQRLKWTVFILLFSTYIVGFEKTLQAQNLVINPSFEDTIPCSTLPPPNYSSCDGPCSTPPWFEPTFGSTDYFNYYHSPNCNGGGGNNPNYYSDILFGHQFPRTGFGMVGILPYTDLLVDYREYLSGELPDTLKSGHDYCVLFYVSLSNNSDRAIWSLGLYFTNDSLIDFFNFQNITPHILNTAGSFITDTINWTQISGTYTAQGGEKFITIGNFFNNANTDTLIVIPENFIPSHQQSAYYYIDDVSIIDCTVGIEEIATIPDLIVSPNPVQESFTFHLSLEQFKSVELELHDISGGCIIS
jgi:hypothetical protein